MTVLIESDYWRLWSNPEMGVQWMAGEVRHQQQWHAVLPECRLPSVADSSVLRAGQSSSAPLPAASFHMLPYSNRIRGGRFNFQGSAHQLLFAETHAIHGAVRKLPWRIVSQTPQSLLCELDSSEHPGFNWPWPMRARIEQSVDGAILNSALTLTNPGDKPMPVGGGWHPYFVRTILGSEATLTLPVDQVYPDSNGDCLPDGAAVALPAELDFRQPRELDASQRIDCCLAGLQGSCVIDWQEAGIKLTMQASELCRYLVFFNPDMPHFAVEPVTNANDAFNLASRGIENGMQVLAPDESLSISMALSVELY